MRASRLLQTLLLLQNRGRMTSRELANELQVTRRTILRDVEAMTEAGLPIIVHRGARGGIELGFGYSARLTGLTADEAEALGVILNAPVPALRALGMEEAARQARTKLIESFPDTVRGALTRAQAAFRIAGGPGPAPDPRIAALAQAVRDRHIVRLRAQSPAPQTIYPATLTLGADGWSLTDARAPDAPIPIRNWGEIDISARTFPKLDAPRAPSHDAPV